MFLKLYLCFLLCCFLKGDVVSGKESESSSENLDDSLFEDWGNRQEPFRLLENMIGEARAIVLNIMRGELSDEIKTELEKQNVDLSGSYDGVSKLVKKCLRKAKNKEQEEGKELVKKCFEKAIGERQTEEGIGEEQPTIQSCIQDAMLEASQMAAPLMAEAQEYGNIFREMLQKTANGLANCRGEVRPFQCMMGVWTEAQTNMTFMRDQVIEMMLVARDIYIQYTDNVRKCITPVEGIDGEDEEVEEQEEDGEEEEDGTKKKPTNPQKVTPAYYDPVVETKRKFSKIIPPVK